MSDASKNVVDLTEEDKFVDLTKDDKNVELTKEENDRNKKRKLEEGSEPVAKRKKLFLSLPNRHVLSEHQDWQLVRSIKNFISNTWGYKKLDETGSTILSELARKVGATFDMAFCCWRNVGNFYGMCYESQLRSKIHGMDESGFNLASLKVDVPPLNIVRRFLAMKRNWKKGRIKSLIKKLTTGGAPPQRPDDISEELFEQILQIAARDDFTGKATDQKVQEESKQFENDMQEWCRDKGLTFKTEDDLKKSPEKCPTPDILFDQPITLNGRGGIRWLELKNYYGSFAANKQALQSWKKQLNRYGNAYGNGAIVFRYGFSFGTSEAINRFLVVDASAVFENKV